MPRQDVGQLAFDLRARQHPVDQVRPVERSDQLEMIAQPELRHDVAADAGRGGRGVGVQAQVGEERAQPSELAVLGPEIVPPLADAVRLVHRHEGDLAAAEHRRETRRCPRRRAAPARRTAGDTGLLADPPPPMPSGRTPGRCCSTPPPRRCRPACRPGPSSTR